MKRTHLQIVLDLPEVVALLIVFGRHVVQQMTNNPALPSPTPSLAAVTADLDALQALEATTRTRAQGSAAARDVQVKVVEDDLKGLASYTYGIATQNPGQAVAIIESAGLRTKQYTHKPKVALAVVLSATPGEVLVRAKSRGRGAAYEWQLSRDGGATWVSTGLTNVANTSLPGLTVGTTYLVRFRATFKNTTSDWSQVVSFLMH